MVINKQPFALKLLKLVCHVFFVFAVCGSLKGAEREILTQAIKQLRSGSPVRDSYQGLEPKLEQQTWALGTHVTLDGRSWFVEVLPFSGSGVELEALLGKPVYKSAGVMTQWVVGADSIVLIEAQIGDTQVPYFAMRPSLGAGQWELKPSPVPRLRIISRELDGIASKALGLNVASKPQSPSVSQQLSEETAGLLEDEKKQMQKMRFGTAFAVSESHLITCWHVVQAKPDLRVLIEGKAIEARLVNFDADLDLALVRVDTRLRPLAFAPPDDLELGQDIQTIGYPNVTVQGTSPKLTKGNISSLAGIADSKQHYQISSPVQPGNSGGPLLDMRERRVVGVVVARLDDLATLRSTGTVPQNVNYAVKGGVVEGFLRANNVNVTRRSPNTPAEQSIFILAAGESRVGPTK